MTSTYYRPTKITTREEEVLALRSAGLSRKEVAAILGMSVNTVSPTTHRVMRKYRVRTVTGAIRRYRIERFERLHNGVMEHVTATIL